MNLTLFTRNSRGEFYLQVAVSLLIFICAFAVISFRIDQAPDIFTDEIIYSRVALRAAGEGALVWDSGGPFIVHPPLYYLFAGLFQTLTGKPDQVLYSPGDIFSTVANIRLLNSLFGALTCVVLFWFGRQLHSVKLGLLVAVLFLLDPFALRINRRAMLETQAMLFALVGFAVFWNDIKRQTSAQKPAPIAIGPLLAGLFLGGALLTKELAFIFLLPLVAFCIWEILRKIPWKLSTRKSKSVKPPSSQKWASSLWLPTHTISALAIALLTYSLYPIWISISGLAQVYMDEKLLGLRRLLGLVQITGWNRSGISFLDLLLERLTHYGTSYLILVLGGFGVVYLLVWGRRQLAGRFLASIGIILYPFFAFIALFGSGNDQFFYLLLVPAILIFGYALFSLVTRLSEYRSRGKDMAFAGRSTTLIIAGIAVIFLLVNAAFWIDSYATGSDNGYTQFAEFIETNLPDQSTVNASGDPIKFRYFLPEHTITAAATSAEAIASGAQYFALAPKDVLMRYGRIQPELADWIVANGKLLFSTTGSSYGDIYLYEVSYDASTSQAAALQSSHQLQGSQFKAAQAGFISSLVLLLLLWLLFVVILSSVIYLSANPAGQSDRTINDAHRI